MKAIIIGATSGIGKELAKLMAKKSWELGLTARRTNLLEELQQGLPTKVHIVTMDVADTETSRTQFADLVTKMKGVDLVIVNAGIGWTTLEWEYEQQIAQVNAIGFAAIANAAFHYFAEQKQGHLVGISSVASLCGSSRLPMYSATKAFMSSYLQGLQYRTKRKKMNIMITDIRPGFVDTPMTTENKFMFWVAPVEKAARQILRAIEKKKYVVYVTKRWVLVAQFIKWMPHWVLQKLF